MDKACKSYGFAFGKVRRTDAELYAELTQKIFLRGSALAIVKQSLSSASVPRASLEARQWRTG